MQATFDYSALPVETALELRMSAERVRMRLKRSAEDIIAIGQELTEAKERLPHGQFLPWIAVEFEMTDRTALNFMRVAERFGSKSEIISDLPVTAIYALAAPSTPEPVVQKVIAGEIPATADAIRAAKEAERQAKEAKEQTRQLELELAVRDRERQDAQRRIANLTQAIDEMDTQMRALRDAPLPEPIIKETVKEVVPDAVKQQLAETQRKLADLQKQRDDLLKRTLELQKQAEAETQRQFAGQNAKQIRLKWFSTRNAAANALRKLLADLPLSADTEQFDADDWQGLAELLAMTERVSDELRMLQHSPTMIVEG